MASTTQAFAQDADFDEQCDPSYFVYANRAARKQQAGAIAPGMAIKLYFGAIPAGTTQIHASQNERSQDGSTTSIASRRDSQGEIIEFQDPWFGIFEMSSRGNRPSGIFYGL